MKNSIILLAVLLGAEAATAQDSDYLPIAREGVKWVYYAQDLSTRTMYPITYYFDGEIGNEIDGKYIRKKCWRVCGWDDQSSGVTPEPELIALVSESDRRVFVRLLNKFSGDMSLISWSIGQHNINGYYTTEFRHPEERACGPNEVVVYDFNDYARHLYKAPRAYNAETQTIEGYWGVFKQDEVTINGRSLKRYEIGRGPSKEFGKDIDDTAVNPWSPQTYINQKAYVIEGYGAVFSSSNMNSASFFLLPVLMDYNTCNLFFSHIEEDGKIVYKGEEYDMIQQQLLLYGYNPDRGDTDVSEIPVTEVDGGDAPYYDMQGHAVAAPSQPGIYIHNGQKVVVK